MQPESTTQFYTWQQYRCAYEVYHSTDSTIGGSTPLLLIHPIGVGLSRHFWERFCREWMKAGGKNSIYNPDLLGCGESDMPHVAYAPTDWAKQLQHFLETVVRQPVIVVVQGASLPIAIELVKLQTASELIPGLVLSGPPTWKLLTTPTPIWRQRLLWNLLFDAPGGAAFYSYARRVQFLRSFSVRQLFDRAEAVDSQWLDMLVEGAKNPASRYAVFSFLAGFWRKNYEEAIAAIAQPTLVLMGQQASSISRKGDAETPDERLTHYLKCLPQGQGFKIPGRNVLPYESTSEFVSAMVPFVKKLS